MVLFGLREALRVDVDSEACAGGGFEVFQPVPQMRLKSRGAGAFEQEAEAVAAADQPQRRGRRPEDVNSGRRRVGPRAPREGGGGGLRVRFRRGPGFP